MSHRRRLLASVAVLAVAAAGCLAAFSIWHRSAASRRDGGPPAQADAGLNILLITLDTTRADRLGCYGYAQAETPALDGLAAAGVRFANAFTAAPLTLPAHATILTGHYPPEHGLHDNGRGRLGPEPPTLAEIAARHGRRTAAFVASFVLDRQFGLNRGFAHYDDRTELQPGDDNPMDREVRGNVVADRALAWLEKNGDQPFFAWVHFYDPHAPYDPPEPFKTRFAKDPYDAEIAFMDSQIKRLLDFLDARKLRPRTLLVVAGDHGESFGEHQEFGHGPLVYDSTMRVPLIMVPPGSAAPRLPPGKTDKRTVSLADVMPTVLDLAGWPRPAGMSGPSLLAADRPERACYGESEYLLNGYGWAPLHCLTAGAWKYIDCPEPELYHIDPQADPKELNNLAAATPRLAAEMKARLDAMRSAFKTRQAEQFALDPEAIKALRQLGYLAGSNVSQTQPAVAGPAALRRDPKSAMGLHNAFGDAKVLAQQDKLAEAIARLEPVVRQSPESTEPQLFLANLYLQTGKRDKALACCEACLKLGRADRTLLALLGRLYFENGRSEEAARIFRQALRSPQDPMEPQNPRGVSSIMLDMRINLGVTLTRLKKPDEAAEQYELVVKDDPQNVSANLNLAALLAAKKDFEAAARHYRAILDQAAPDVGVPGKLGAVVAQLGKFDEAIELYRRSLKGKPADKDTSYNLGLALVRQKKYADALAAWRDGLAWTPNDPLLKYNLAWWLATCPDAKLRDGAEAARLAGALPIGDPHEEVLAKDLLAAAQAESGDFTKAVENGRAALHRAEEIGAANLANAIRPRLGLYLAAKPYHQAP